MNKKAESAPPAPMPPHPLPARGGSWELKPDGTLAEAEPPAPAAPPEPPPEPTMAPSKEA